MVGIFTLGTDLRLADSEPCFSDTPPYTVALVKLSNVDVAAALNLSQSTVSRMRAGHRLASLETLQTIARQYNVDSSLLLSAAAKASQGQRGDWIALLDEIFDDGEEDPDGPSEPEQDDETCLSNA